MPTCTEQDLKRSWVAKLQTIADEMEDQGFEVAAEHLDFIAASLETEESIFTGSFDPALAPPVSSQN